MLHSHKQELPTHYIKSLMDYILDCNHSWNFNGKLFELTLIGLYHKPHTPELPVSTSFCEFK